ncbi:MAG: DsbA family oxidoreductase, partial [Betaproteobacteria bacterium]
ARKAVQTEDRRWRAMGVEGVPFFLFNGRLAVSGAQGSAALLSAMKQAEWTVRQPMQQVN